MPLRDGEAVRLFGLASGAFRDRGLVVYTGRDVTAEDLRTRFRERRGGLVDEDRRLADLGRYIGLLQAFKIGNIVALELATDDPGGFSLRKVRERPPVTPAKLP